MLAEAASATFVVVLAVLLLLCLKIKSSKKDPAFVGLEGTIVPISETEKRCGSGDDEAGLRTPQPQSNRTPSRSGERRLPEIPRSHGGDDNSDLYATLAGESNSDDEEEEEESAVDGPSTSLLERQRGTHHPYAKVKKTNVEHPYATVQKPSSQQQGTATTTANGSVDFSDSEDDRLLLRPNALGSRSGSSRSSNGYHQHGVDVGGELSRQATPLPPEPPAPPPAAAGSGMLQNPGMHFSGDSQDSSKGYTSITVREPVRHIQLHQSRGAGGGGGGGGSGAVVDATYATVSETSDEMYAAIEDPTYIPAGTASQSNSDTYAVIDLPEESEVELAPTGNATASTAPTYHSYSKVDKSRKRGGPQAPPPPLSEGMVANARHPQVVEEMYAKVHKRTAVSASSPDEADFDLPVGASAMHPNSEVGGTRPKTAAMAFMSERGAVARKPPNRTEINYSDFETTRYDREKLSGHKTNADSEGGYEIVPDAKGVVQAEDGYQLMPETEWKRQHYRTYDDKESGYECLPDYWRSSNSGGYETVSEVAKDPAGYEVLRRRLNDDEDANYDSIDRRNHAGYERLPRPPEDEPPYDRLDHNSDGELGYETIFRGQLQHQRNEYDPGYEVVISSSVTKAAEPGYETVASGPTLQPDYEVVPTRQTLAAHTTSSSSRSSNRGSPMTMIQMCVQEISGESSESSPVSGQRRSSVVVIEHVSDVSAPSSVVNDEINTHIFI